MAAVYRQDYPSDKRCLRSAEEGDGCGDVFGITHAADGVLQLEEPAAFVIAFGGPQFLQVFGEDMARGDGIDGDPYRTVFDRQLPGQADNRRLADLVDHPSGRLHQAVRRGDIDDAADFGGRPAHGCARSLYRRDRSACA